MRLGIGHQHHLSGSLQEDARRRRLKKKRQNLSVEDVKHIASMMGLKAEVSTASSSHEDPSSHEEPKD